LGDRAADLAIADECRLNVLWWHDMVGGERALEIEVPSHSLTSGLSAHYRHLDRVPLSALSGSPAPRLPFGNGLFQLVTSYGHCPSPATLIELRRVLAPGGTLLLAAGNRWWNGRWRGGHQSPGSATTSMGLMRRLRRIGFAEVCPYWIEPSLAEPRNLIPALAGRARQFEAIRAREWGADTVRSLLMAAGLPSVLYPGLLFLARVAGASRDGAP
jgi:SAM-dependent methyltransferase